MLTRFLVTLSRLLFAVVFERGAGMSMLVFEGLDLGGTLLQQPVQTVLGFTQALAFAFGLV
ncbi:hypothetical protein D3C81_1958580 [compost metagenome]